MSDSSGPTALPQTAEGWAARLTGPDLSGGELDAFLAWRREPQNRRAWETLAGSVAAPRYVVRPQGERFRVIDIWTGETAVIAMTAQAGLSAADAAHTAGLLNARARDGDRALLQ